MNLFPFRFLNLDFVIVFIVYLFVFDSKTGAGAFAFGLGIFTDILSGGILGLFTFIYLIIFLSINFISRLLDLLAPGGQIAVIFIAVVLKEFLLLGLLTLFSMKTFFSFPDFIWVIISALSTGVLSPFVFLIMNCFKKLFVEEERQI